MLYIRQSCRFIVILRFLFDLQNFPQLFLDDYLVHRTHCRKCIQKLNFVLFSFNVMDKTFQQLVKNDIIKLPLSPVSLGGLKKLLPRNPFLVFLT